MVFKATLTASIGSCFAQHLWLVLRTDTTSVSLIEKLFVLRSNVIALGDPKAISRAPILCSMALYVWCIGIATIYPPGSITVEWQPHVTTYNMEVSIMNPAPAKGLKLEDYLRSPTLADLRPMYIPFPEINTNFPFVYG